jgi:hypothetical protein
VALSGFAAVIGLLLLRELIEQAEFAYDGTADVAE